MADLQSPIFTNEDAARNALEAVRWPNGPVCPHCGGVDRQAKVEGAKKSHRPGLYYCNHCQGQYTAMVGTVFERSKIPLSKWWMACHLMGSSKKGISAHQMHRMLGVTYKTAWFMAHRIREAMTDMSPTPMASGGGTVEADETFIGRKKGTRLRAGHGHKMAVMSLIERGGKARSFHVTDTNSGTLVPLIKANVSKSATVMTDAAWAYGSLPLHFARHESVNHQKDEWVRGDAHTNTIEGFFSVFKRGMKGVYQHCSEQHLHRYLAEFDFRYSNRSALGVEDVERVRRLMKGVEGKRLTYRRTDKERRVSQGRS